MCVECFHIANSVFVPSTYFLSSYFFCRPIFCALCQIWHTKRFIGKWTFQFALRTSIFSMWILCKHTHHTCFNSDSFLSKLECKNSCHIRMSWTEEKKAHIHISLPISQAEKSNRKFIESLEICLSKWYWFT